MRLSYRHGYTRDEAIQALERLREELLGRDGHEVSDFRERWNGGVLQLSFRARGLNVSGTLAVTDNDLTLDVPLPWAVRIFEGQIRARIVDALDGLFR